MKFGRKMTIFTAGIMLLAFLAVALAPPAMAAEKILVIGTYVNVRASATTKAQVVGTVTKGNYYSVIKQGNGWVQISLPGGKAGWVAGWLVKKVSVTPVAPATNKTAAQTTSAGLNLKGVVAGSYVNVRSGPGTSFGKVTSANKGNTVTILKQQGDWYQVRLPQGSQGWVATWLVKRIAVAPVVQPVNNPTPQTNPTNQNLKGVVTGSYVNVRSGPGTSFGVVTKAYKGETVTMLKQQGDWYQVRMTKGSQGWVAGWLVTTMPIPKSEPPSEPQTGPQTEPQTPPIAPGGQADIKVAVDLQVYDSSSPVVIITGERSLEYSLEESQSDGTLTLSITGAELEKGDQEIYVGQPGLARVKAQKSTTQAGKVTVTLFLEQGIKFACTQSVDKRVLTLTEKQVVSRPRVVAIDAGHGGIDPGAIGPSKLQEKEVVLSISQKLAAKLEQAGYTVVLTRPYDIKVPLTERAVIAGQKEADIFVSIHANASDSSAVNGTSTYYYAPATIERLKAQEAERKRLAQTVQNRLVDQLGRRNGGILQANFAVLRETTMPSILVETAYISNSVEERLLAQNSVRDTVAEGIFQGIREYFEQSPQQV